MSGGAKRRPAGSKANQQGNGNTQGKKRNRKPNQSKPANQPKPKRAARRTQGQPKVKMAPKLDWKLACADAPTRHVVEWTQLDSVFDAATVASTVGPLYNEQTLFIFYPRIDVGGNPSASLFAVDAPGLDAHVSPTMYAFTRYRDKDLSDPISIHRGETTNVSWGRRVASFPDLSTLCGTAERYAYTSASVMIKTKNPGTSMVMHIRRVTESDCAVKAGLLIASLQSDMTSTFHYDLEGSASHIFRCGIHDSAEYGVLSSGTTYTSNNNTNFLGGPGNGLGAVMFCFSGVRTGDAIAKPGLRIITRADATHELNTTNAHYQDNNPETSVVHAKEAHSTYAKSAAIKVSPKHGREALGSVNAMVSGLQAAESVSNAAAGAIRGGAKLVSTIVAAKRMGGMLSSATAANTTAAEVAALAA